MAETLTLWGGWHYPTFLVREANGGRELSWATLGRRRRKERRVHSETPPFHCVLKYNRWCSSQG